MEVLFCLIIVFLGTFFGLSMTILALILALIKMPKEQTKNTVDLKDQKEIK
jgi:hypothetical protein